MSNMLALTSEPEPENTFAHIAKKMTSWSFTFLKSVITVWSTITIFAKYIRHHHVQTQKLFYPFQFIVIHPFQFIIIAIIRVALIVSNHLNRAQIICFVCIRKQTKTMFMMKKVGEFEITFCGFTQVVVLWCSLIHWFIHSPNTVTMVKQGNTKSFPFSFISHWYFMFTISSASSDGNPCLNLLKGLQIYQACQLPHFWSWMLLELVCMISAFQHRSN